MWRKRWLGLADDAWRSRYIGVVEEERGVWGRLEGVVGRVEEGRLGGWIGLRAVGR